MSKPIRPRLLQESWSQCEEVIHSMGLRTISYLERKLGAARIANIQGFLSDTGFVVDGRLSPMGSEFFVERFLKNNSDVANRILTNAIQKYEPTQAICQLLWGRPRLTKINIYELLVFEDYIDARSVTEEDLGSFLMLLNTCGIIKYSKQKNEITVIFNPRTETSVSPLTRFLSPDTPFSNLRNLWDVIRGCDGFLHWFDKHFPPKGLECLHDEADGSKLAEIKILAGIQDFEMMERLRRDFREFREELVIRNISCELRVICDKHLLSEIHDRWIVSKSTCYNVPPVNSMLKGQYSELKQTSNRPPFNEWWSRGSDILEKWSSIDSYLSTLKNASASPVESLTSAH